MVKKVKFFQICVDNGTLYGLDNSGEVWELSNITKRWIKLNDTLEDEEIIDNKDEFFYKFPSETI